jgi:hypothetical protein
MRNIRGSRKMDCRGHSAVADDTILLEKAHGCSGKFITWSWPYEHEIVEQREFDKKKYETEF